MRRGLGGASKPLQRGVRVEDHRHPIMHRPDQFIRRRREQRKGGERSTVRFFPCVPQTRKVKLAPDVSLKCRGNFCVPSLRHS